MTDYRAEYVRKTAPAATAWAVKRGKQLLLQYKPWIDRYRGGMPGGFAAAIMAIESNGIPTTVGDTVLGEYGLFQVAADIPKVFGFPAEARLSAENNIFFGMMEYQTEVIKWKLAFPHLIDMGSADAWKLARLAFAIGGTARTKLAVLAAPQVPGKVYDAIVNYVDKYGGIALGSQSADKIWYRVKMVQHHWDIGQAVQPDLPNVPMLVPDPPAGKYQIKPLWAAQFVKPAPIGFLAAIAAAVVAVYFAWKRPSRPKPPLS